MALNFSQALKSGGLSNVITPKNQAAPKPGPTPMFNPTQAFQSGGLQQQNVLGASTGPSNGPDLLSYNNQLTQMHQAQPSTGGQAGGGGSFGQQLSLTPPPAYNPNPPQDDQLGLLRQQYQNSANDIQAQNPLLDQSYNQAKTDIGNTITDAQKQADLQKTNNESTYGNLLKQNAQTYRDVGKQQQGTFSQLGTLDSSAYGDQSMKLAQSSADNASNINLDKTKSNTGIDNTLTTYTNQAHSQLAGLANQYQQGKNAIASALAQNDLSSAQAIQQKMTEIRQQAYAIQNNIANFANQAALMKSMGYGVGQTIGGYNGQQFAQNQQQQMQGVLGNAANTYQMPQQGAQGQGYIAPTGKKYNSYADYLSQTPQL